MTRQPSGQAAACAPVASSAVPEAATAPMRNQLFLSYFVERFKDTRVSPMVVRLGVLAAIAGPAFGAGLLLFDASAWMATLAAASVLGTFFMASRAARAYRTLRARADQLQNLSGALLATNADCLKLIGLDGRIMEISEVGAELMEVSSSSQLIGADWLGFWQGDDAHAARAAFQRALDGKQARFTGYCTTALGTPKWWDSTLYPVKSPHGRVSAVLCPSRDISEQTVAQGEAARALALLKDVEAHVPVVFWSASPDFRTVYHVSAGFDAMWRLPRDVLYRDPSAWQVRLPAEDLAQLRLAMRTMARDGLAAQSEFRVAQEDGGWRWVRVSASPVRDANGRVERVVSVCIDITEERRRIADLDRLAHTDNLTGLGNRHALIELLHRRCEEVQPFSILLADVDRFKVLNDTAGAVMADALLRDVGQAIARAVPADAFVARPGGDEFAIVLANAHSIDELMRVYENVRSVVGEPHLLGGVATTITLSAGVASFPLDAATPEALLSRADVAMYAAKRAGRDHCRVFGTEESAAIREFQLERELRHALPRGEFVLHFQPQFRTATREMTGAEALIRWNRPEHGLVSPAIFVPLLEETGLIGEVGLWVFEESLRQMVGWLGACGPAFAMSVNVSAKQLSDETLPQRFSQSAARHGIATRQLTLEITESALVERAETAQSVLRELQRLGFRVALDDFGTGYSSLSYLTRLRPDVLKLDRSMVVDIDCDPSARTVVTGIVALAQALNIRVVAEGVERQSQLDALREMGCELVQGFLLGRPVAAPAFLDRFVLAEAARD
jgi:diguanylate cyclase (GGDEF)-like protein